MKKAIIGVAIVALGTIAPVHADASRPALAAWRCAYMGDANVGFAIPSNAAALTVDGHSPNDQSCKVQTKIGLISGTWVRLGSVTVGG
jgi:hypothetical protein